MSLFTKSQSILSNLRAMPTRKPVRRVPMLVEELEPRILHSADIGPALLHDGSATPQVETRILDSGGEFAVDAVQSQQTQTELVIVDTNTPDYQQLADDIRSEAAGGRQIEVVLLDNRSNGIDQITALLSGRKDIGAVHIISHGSEGEVQLGGSVLDLQSLRAYAGEIESWANALTLDADLLIYGCNVAGSADGRTLVDALSRLTGADVAASESLTGSAAAGGDWVLEYSAGTIQARLALTDHMQGAWAGLLNVATLQAIQDTSISVIAGNTSNNFGASTQLLLDAAGGGVGNQRLLVEFDLSTIPVGATINSATLQMQSTAIGATMNLDVYELLQSWTEGTGNGTPGAASWNERSTGTNWTTAGGTYNATAIATLNTGAVGQHSWDLTSLVQAWVTGTNNNGVLLGSSDGGSANVTYSSLQGTTAPRLVIDYTSTNAAPVLTGGNDLNAIIEDIPANPGTLVSALLAGHVTDPDAGALSGVAVTAVDNTNGTWQYSTDAGGTWNNFGNPSDTNARLLRSSDFVRFVPTVDFNGTVNNGLTFRAWDQTSGTAGGTADTTSTTSTILDTFSAVSYTNNNGTASWSAGWVDTDGNSSSGNITVTGGQLALSVPLLGSDSIYREANLSGATSATLSFTYNNLLGLLGNVSLQVSSNGGTSYTPVATFSSGSPPGLGIFSTDISAYIAANTRIQFVLNGVLLGGSMQVDDVQISYVSPLNGGNTAFSTATASSSITVNSVNDAPAGTNSTVNTPEDTAYVFNSANFGFSDPADTPANNLLAVKITTLPSAGSLTLNGLAVTTGQFVAASDIAGGDLVFTPAAGVNGAGYASFTFQVQDDGGGANLDLTARTMTIDVAAVNDPPTLSAPGSIAVTEDAATAITGISFSDVDAGSGNVLATFNVPQGTLAAVSGGGVTVGGSATTLTLTGSIASINAFIAASSLTYTTASNDTNAVNLGVSVNDQSNTGSGGAQSSAVSNITLNVTAVNDPPTVSAPASMAVTEDVATAITGISFSDVDVGSGNVLATFTVPQGTLAAASGSGVTVGGTATALTLTGSIANINAFIASSSLTYTTTLDDVSAVSLGVSVDDQGNTGSGGALSSAVSNVMLNVTAVDDAPVNSVPGTQSTNQNTSLVFSTANGNAISINDVDAGSSAVQLTLSASNGTVTLATTAGLIFAVGTGTGEPTMQFSGSIAAINTALNGLSFTPNAGFTGAAALSIVTDDLGNSGSGGPLTAGSTININVAVAPVPPVTTPVVPIIDPIPVPVPFPPTVAADPVAPPLPTPVTTAGPDAPPFDEVPSAGGTVEPEAAVQPVDLTTGSDRSVSYTLTSPSSRNARAFGVSYSPPAAQWLLFGDEAAGVPTDSSALSFGLGATGDGHSALQSPALIDALDRLREGLQEQSGTDALIVATTAAASLGLSVGYVLWLLRGGVLISSMLSSLPAWRMVDPLPILGRLDDEDDEDADDDSIESMVAAKNAAPIARPVVPAEPANTTGLTG